MRNVVCGLIGLLCLAACGGGSSGGGGFQNDPTPPSPYAPLGNYMGIAYSELGQPTGLTQSYPSSFWPSNLPAFQIAYGSDDESAIANLSALVHLKRSICSATPVYYDSQSNTTFLIGAAHCFVISKSSPTNLNHNDLMATSDVRIYHGVGSSLHSWDANYDVKAIYLRQDYCYNGSFAIGGECQNFTPQEGASGGQGNDIAIIQVVGQYADPESYPQIVPATQYPQTYTMAPVLSIGYGINTQTPIGDMPSGCTVGSDCAVMYYTANYQYWQQDTIGYHYLYNSYYNNGGFGQHGYTSLICGGDSGGGDLFWNGSHWLLLSEHTYGPSDVCGTFYSFLPDGSTNVSAYYDWVQSILYSTDPVAACNNGGIANCVTNGI
ncbi:MAG: hypothetical protein E6Q32_05540 [Neisseriales bacterium]|nr:MAG: hypothetical protein E6Q32_05540 [Neisseriales bacterium]